MTAKIAKSRAVFFDKDGTLVKDVPYNVNPDLIVLNEGAAETVRKLKKAGFKIFIVSNQS
jgi:D-glycero-D-manno-heptose 1,7-bisphosphate phosphatase